jgi:Inositol hexakisphosphate
MTPPLPGSYWVVPGHLLAGDYAGGSSEGDARRRLARLREAGVTYFLDLTVAGELDPYDALIDRAEVAVQYRRMPIHDFGVPGAGEMARILDAIDEALAAGHVVYLHCRGGLGRTGTVVACHLVRHGASPSAALATIADWLRETPSRGRPSPETPEQLGLVASWRAGK